MTLCHGESDARATMLRTLRVHRALAQPLRLPPVQSTGRRREEGCPVPNRSSSTSSGAEGQPPPRSVHGRWLRMGTRSPVWRSPHLCWLFSTSHPAVPSSQPIPVLTVGPRPGPWRAGLEGWRALPGDLHLPLPLGSMPQPGRSVQRHSAHTHTHAGGSRPSPAPYRAFIKQTVPRELACTLLVRLFI